MKLQQLKALEFTVNERRILINNLLAKIHSEEKEVAYYNNKLEIEVETSEHLSKKISNTIEESRKEHERLQGYYYLFIIYHY